MSDATYTAGVYMDSQGDRIVVSTCGSAEFDGGTLSIEAGTVSFSSSSVVGTVSITSSAVLSVGADAAFTQAVREAAICASCGDLPYSGHVFVGNSSAAIVHYTLPEPDTAHLGSVLTVHALAFDDTINSSTHWYIETASSNPYGVGSTTANSCICWDSTFEAPFTFYIQMATTNLYKVALPGTTGLLASAITIGTTLTT